MRCVAPCNPIPSRRVQHFSLGQYFRRFAVFVGRALLGLERSDAGDLQAGGRSGRCRRDSAKNHVTLRLKTCWNCFRWHRWKNRAMIRGYQGRVVRSGRFADGSREVFTQRLPPPPANSGIPSAFSASCSVFPLHSSDRSAPSGALRDRDKECARAIRDRDTRLHQIRQ